MPRGTRVAAVAYVLGLVLAVQTRAQPPLPTSVVVVPAGSTTVLLGGRVTQQINCNVLPHTSVRVEMTVLDGTGATVSDRIVDPSNVLFKSKKNASTRQSKPVTLVGLRNGRFYLTYRLAGTDAEQYKLSATSAVVFVTDEQGWRGITYDLALNGTIFLVGLAFFVWRRLHRVELPIWQRHRLGLFERANYDDLPPAFFEKRYRDIRAATLRGRLRAFWSIPCDGHYVCHSSGIPAALLLRFHMDAAHLCAILTFFSIGTLVPVNYLSGNSKATLPANSFQQTTISNVPLYSDWYWVHVGYCYVVAALILAFLARQHALLSTLRRRTKRIVGARSILIHAGLPPAMTGKKLRALLAEYYEPRRIEDVTVVYDFRQLHNLLDCRQALAREIDRIRGLDAGYEYGMLSWSLLWCPGSLLVPSPSQVAWSAITCRPCRYYWRHADCRCCQFVRRTTETAAETERLTYSKVSSDRDIVDSALGREFDALDEELDFFPEEAVYMYTKRQCLGAAFVVFDSTATRNDFVRLVREQSCLGRVKNALHERAYRWQYGRTPRSPRRSVATREAFATEASLSPFLANLVLTSAPEPDDVLWKNLRYEPLSLWSIVSFLARQVTTLSLLLLFSTPTAVLVYIKLDATSRVYTDLLARHSLLVSLVATYLPSLLLIIVNWCLLTFLYHVAMLEPTISESRRTRNFLVTGFTYLVVSSVFLPSIGVTAAYLAFSKIGTDGKSYVESFLFKISGTTFFISYVCQRAFLGSIVELTRMGERLAYQPWVLWRAVTVDERREAYKPWPYYYGHDYAMIISVLLVILLGTVITPVLTPFGAVFFYLKFATVKYNFLYVMPYTAGRGHIAQTAYGLVAVGLVIFEVVMAFVFLQIAGHRQFAAMVVLLVCTGFVYFFYVVDTTTRSSGKQSQRAAAGESPLLLPSPRLSVSDHVKRGKPSKSKKVPPQLYSPISSSSASTAATLSPPHTRRTIFSPTPTTLEQDLGLLERYTDPYKVALSIFKLLGVHEKFHSMSSTRTQLKYAFHRLQRHVRDSSTDPQRSLLVGSASRMEVVDERDDGEDGRDEETITPGEEQLDAV